MSDREVQDQHIDHQNKDREGYDGRFKEGGGRECRTSFESGVVFLPARQLFKARHWERGRGGKEPEVKGEVERGGRRGRGGGR